MQNNSMRTTELYYELQKRYQEVNRILLSKEEEMHKKLNRKDLLAQ